MSLLDGSHYWPWWLSASAFALLVVGMWLIERRLLGVSGSFTRALSPESASERAMYAANEELLADALLKATLEEFGQEAVDEYLKEMAAEKVSDGAAASAPRPGPAPLPRIAHLSFLAMMIVGGFVGAASTGRWQLRATLGSLHTQLMHGRAWSLVVLVLAGVLVGVGTRMAGGCTSGHGLSGCGRLQSASVVATLSFFGAGVITSLLLRGAL